MGSPPASQVHVPLDTRSSVYFVDESGSKGSGGDFFVVAAVKTNDPDYLTRGMASIRTRARRFSEMRFRELNRSSVPMFRDLTELLYDSGAIIGAFIVDKKIHDPFVNRAQWEGHAWVTSALIKGMTSRKELATVLSDGISTPAGVAYGTHLRQTINSRFRSMRVVSAVSLDSKTCDGLQLADMVASAIAYERKTIRAEGAETYAQRTTPKAEAAKYLARVFGVDSFNDVRNDRVNVKSIRPDRSQQEVVDSAGSVRHTGSRAVP